jgi:2-iminobutanoate/2-iminopropanoate deaminase
LKTAIVSVAAPPARSHYSQGLRSGQLLCTAGFLGTHPDGSGLVPGGFEAEVRQALDNALAVVAAGGGGPEHVVRISVALTDLAWFDAMDAAVAERFAPPYPARNTLGVKELWGGALVSVELTAVLAN